jgi:hypothetical protein
VSYLPAGRQVEILRQPPLYAFVALSLCAVFLSSFKKKINKSKKSVDNIFMPGIFPAEKNISGIRKTIKEDYS